MCSTWKGMRDYRDSKRVLSVYVGVSVRPCVSATVCLRNSAILTSQMTYSKTCIPYYQQ